jgi:hypothetical protein
LQKISSDVYLTRKHYNLLRTDEGGKGNLQGNLMARLAAFSRRQPSLISRGGSNATKLAWSPLFVHNWPQLNGRVRGI